MKRTRWWQRPTGPPNPFEVWLFIACLMQGCAVLVGLARPTSIEEALPPGLRLGWGALLTLGGALVLTGLHWPGDPFTGLEIKKPGLWAAAAATLAYGVAVSFYGAVGLAVAISNISFAVACLVRLWQITRIVRMARGVLVAARSPIGG